ncbi:MAG: TlpA family protein disulfide reductase [Synergistaceae bacterium]|nr:TlpA family protein disulfide reductase [Synergistaceae bacterium]
MKFQKRSVLLAAAIALLAVLSSAVVSEALETFSFESKTFDGKSVTDAIFKDSRLTMVNFWATWCPPCVREMPDLAGLADSMPEGTQLAGVLLDVTAGNSSARSSAEKILKNSGADFVQILYDPSMDSYTDGIEAIPTTIFVDSEGRVIGEPIVGSRSGREYRAAIEKALKKTEAK